jgi:cytosine/adenosine deaminase-related metal-dependent hydrolase
MSATSTRNRILRACAPIVLAALEDAAEARMERTEGWCLDCVESAEELCDTHREDRARAEEYWRTFDELKAVLGHDAGSFACSPDPAEAPNAPERP